MKFRITLMPDFFDIKFSLYHAPTRRYFLRNTVTVAKSILGAYVRHVTGEGPIGGVIVEAEAYLYTEPGCHSYNGETPRNRVMFGPAGHVYTYFTYGNHWMMNIVTEKPGRGCAVLIRGLQPVEGIEIMWRNRPKAKREIDLGNGPGKLAAALGIGREEYGLDVVDSRIQVLVPDSRFRRKIVDAYGGIVQTTRIGLGDSKGTELPYRFYLREHPCVSVKDKGQGSK